jgi:two-component system chemotaxis response regulator CheB
MNGRDIVAIGASAGGIEALQEVVRGLPPDLGAAVFVVLHLPHDARSSLPEILSRSGPLPAAHAKDGEVFERGRIYVAPPDRHLLLEDGRVRLERGPSHNRLRPAADPLFGSAARAHGSRVVGVVLSGALDDGTAGLARIKRRGGVAIVQDPSTALYPGMPESALAHVAVDRVVPIHQMAAAIEEAVRGPAPDSPPVDDHQEAEPVWSMGLKPDLEENGTPSVYACPDCHGTLWEFEEDGILRFRCRVGHSFSTEGLLHGHDRSLESTLWAALRSLEENASMRRRLASRMRLRGLRAPAERHEEKGRETERHAGLLRGLLTTLDSETGEPA